MTRMKVLSRVLVSLAALVPATVALAAAAPAAQAVPAMPMVRAGATTVVEGDVGYRSLRIPITLSQPSTVEVDVSVTLINSQISAQNVPATPDEDFVGWKKGKTVRFRPSPKTGLTPTVRYVTVKVISDDAVEPHPGLHPEETIGFLLSNPHNATFPNNATNGLGMGYIVDDDTTTGDPGNRLVGSLMEVDEGDVGPRTLKVTYSLARPASNPVTVVLGNPPATSCGGCPSEFDPRPGLDYKPLSKAGTKTITFKPGQVEKMVTLQLYGADATDQPPYSHRFALPVLAITGDSFARVDSGEVTIVDDDDALPVTSPPVCYDGPGTDTLDFQFLGPIGRADNAAAYFSFDGTCTGLPYAVGTVVSAADSLSAGLECLVFTGSGIGTHVVTLIPEAPTDWWICNRAHPFP